MRMSAYGAIRTSSPRHAGVCSALVLLAVLVAGCGATLNPELESGIAIGEASQGGQGGQGGLAGKKMPALGASGAGVGPTDTVTTAGVETASSLDGQLRLPAAAEGFVTANTPGAAAYKIGPHDVLEVTVFKVQELNRVIQVSDSGTVSLPLVNEMIAAGKTPQEFERELTAKLGEKYLQSPQVTVNVREFNSQRVTVEGAVKTPGVYPIKGKTSLLQMMAYAGGIDSAIATNEVVVFRTRNGKRYAAKFDVGLIRTGNLEDPTLIAGDVIVVNTSDVKNAFNSFMKALPLASFLTLL